MAKPQNAMEVFKFLDKSNCRECGMKTCLAFAAAVFQNRKNIEDCPRLNPDIINRFSSAHDSSDTTEFFRSDDFDKLKNEIGKIKLSERAETIGGWFSNNRLMVSVLGKTFGVTSDGSLFSDIHVNPWVAVPFLNYVLHSKGKDAGGNWVSFRELKGGKERYPLFQKRCEAAMKQVADTYTDLFDDMVHIFNGKQVEQQFESDISVILHPLPKLPVMICYWKPEDGLESDLNVFFDETAEENLDIGSVFSLGTGLTQMLEKLAMRHGFSETAG